MSEQITLKANEMVVGGSYKATGSCPAELPEGTDFTLSAYEAQFDGNIGPDDLDHPFGILIRAMVAREEKGRVVFEEVWFSPTDTIEFVSRGAGRIA